MKKFVLLFLALICFTGYSQNLPDTVAMTVSGKPVLLSEFLFIAQKNGEVDLADAKSLKEYVELFKNFKLKVADAEACGIDHTKSFQSELDGYKAQLAASYLSDKPAEEAVAKTIYDRGNTYLELSHIVFRLPEKTLIKDTLSVYRQAQEARRRIQAGEDFEAIGKELSGKDSAHVVYEHIRCLKPLESVKAFEQAVYSLPVGQISRPIRTTWGFHLIKVHRHIPNPGKIVVSHILIPFVKDSLTGKIKEDQQTTFAQAQALCRRAKSGEDFAALAKTYSSDAGSARKGGQLPPFELGEMVQPFEAAAFALETPGQISDPVETRFGYHIIKLEAKKGRTPFEEEKKGLLRHMSRNEWNFELYRSFDEQMKKAYNYRFYPEVYAELQALCNDYFPSDRAFFEKAEGMQKTLMQLDTLRFPQNEFAYYIQRCPFSTKTYAGDFMQEVYDLFVREIATNLERKNLAARHPEYPHLMQEYRDGMLLFEISNRKIWTQPAGEQKELEEKWIQELSAKYPVVVNWKALKKLKK